VVLWYHGLSEVSSFVSLLVSNPRYHSPGGFPFESVGLAALQILFVMAATSHDFWNGVLGLGLGAAFPSPGPGAWDQGKKLAARVQSIQSLILICSRRTWDTASGRCSLSVRARTALP
jgi:hypothetical protein